MRTAILTTGSQGDVQPFIMLAQALKAAGYTPVMVTSVNFEPQVKQAGLDWRPISVDFQQLIEGESGRNLVNSGRNPIALIREGRRVMQDSTQQIVFDLWDAVQDAEAIICHIGLCIPVQSLAEKLNVPYVLAALQPYLITGAFPHPMWPSQMNLGSLYNRTTGYLIEQLTWSIFGAATNKLRTQKLELPSISAGDFRRRLRQAPILNAFSPQVVTSPNDWNLRSHLTGYWFPPDQTDWQPPPDLLEFLASGSAPVSIGFGSMASRDPEATAQIVLDGLRESGQRGIILTGWDGIRTADLPANIFKLDYAPHDWLFQRMAAIVHHGGAGTTGAGLRAGVPSIIVPFLGDQFYWGARITALGVGPKPIPRKKLTAARLADAIQQAVSNGNMQAKAKALGQAVRTENGIKEAIRLIERYTT
ncbi:MAG: glycosyltransferase [Anaerolineae bacterium]|nr:glycosyltransferase [Anaerolineae bacterium]